MLRTSLQEKAEMTTQLNTPTMLHNVSVQQRAVVDLYAKLKVTAAEMNHK